MMRRPPHAPKVVEALRRLARTGEISVRVEGRCMEPVLSDGEKVLVQGRRHYWPGDILVFRAADGLRAHRLLGYRPSSAGLLAITRPDASLDAWDAPIAPQRILGRITATEERRLRVSLARRLASVGRFVRLAARRLVRHG